MGDPILSLSSCSGGGATFPSKEIVSRSRDGRLVLPILCKKKHQKNLSIISGNQ